MSPLLASPASSFGASLAKLINSCTFSHLVVQSESLCFKYSSYFTKSSKQRMRSAGDVPCLINVKHNSQSEQGAKQASRTADLFSEQAQGSYRLYKSLQFLLRWRLDIGNLPIMYTFYNG